MTIFFFNLKVAYRSLIKSPGQSIISIITLAVGMLFFILSVYWLRYENSYDDFHRDHERLTKVVRMNDRAETGFDEHHFGLLKDELLKNHSFIESATNYYLLHWLITKDQHRHNDIVFLIDNSFPDIFDIENVKGDYRQIFHNPRFVAITEKSAHGIFRNENPIGQTIDINGEVCEVCAIIKDWSNHTSIKFGIIGNLDLETEKLNNWNNMAVHLIVKLSESNDMKSNYYKEVYEENSKRNYSFYPLKDFHRYTIGYKGVSVKYLYVKLFSVLGLILIISAVVNYLMLFISRLKNRMPEIFLYKVNGASSTSVITVLLLEIMMILLAAFVVSMFLFEVTVNYYIEVAMIGDSALQLMFKFMFYYLILFIIIVTVTLIPLLYYKNKLYKELFTGQSGVNHHQRTILSFNSFSLLIQVFISSLFLFASVVFLSQMVYLLNGDFGYDRTNVCTVSYDRVGKNQDSYRLISELKNCEAIEDVALTDSPFLPKRGWKSNSVNKNGLFIPVDIVDVSPRYFDFFSIKKVSGFSDLSEASLEDLAEKQEVVVLNESAADVFEVNDSLSETKDFMIKVYGLPVAIIKDVCYAPILNAVPTLYVVKPLHKFDSYQYGNLVYRYKQGKKKEAEEQVKKVLNLPDDYEYLFYMEESYLEYFKSELILIRIFLTVTLICMFISFFGVYSIMNLVCERRRKEIAIRKINGAGKGGIIRLFLKDYLIITAVALVFALPLGYLFSENWLARFAVKIDIGIEYFLLCFVVIFSLIILIVVAKVLTVANVVPVNELKKN